MFRQNSQQLFQISFSKIDLFLSRSIQIITTGQGLERKVRNMIHAYSGGYLFSISGNIRSLPSQPSVSLAKLMLLSK